MNFILKKESENASNAVTEINNQKQLVEESKNQLQNQANTLSGQIDSLNTKITSVTSEITVLFLCLFKSLSVTK